MQARAQGRGVLHKGCAWPLRGGSPVHLPWLCEPSADDASALTPRELECLRWTLRGKTAWEVGRILGIAEQTAARHLHNASKKLGCVSKHQAAWRAAQLKLIG